MKKLIATGVIFLIVFVTLTGCTSTRTTGLKIDQTILNKIYVGKTTKRELMDLLGPPRAIAVQERPVYLVQPIQHIGPNAILINYNLQLQSEPFFELFRDRHKLNDVHRVYYFLYAISKSETKGLTEYITLKTDRLWVLVNEETEIVEDVYFKPHSDQLRK